jgi:hypothetical protein
VLSEHFVGAPGGLPSWGKILGRVGGVVKWPVRIDFPDGFFKCIYWF